MKLIWNLFKSRTPNPEQKFKTCLMAAGMFTFPAILFQTAAVAQQADSETWYSIEFDGKGVGYERVRTHLISGTSPPTWSCFRRTEIQLKRMGKDLSLSATLWTEQLQDGQLLSFSLERLDGDKRRLQRSGTLDRSTNVMRVSELITGTRRDYDVDPGVTTHSPIVSTWMPGIVDPTKRRTTTPVFFPESAGAANIVSEYRASQRIQHGGKPLTVQRQNFYADGDPSNLTTLSIDQNGRVLRQEKRVFGGVLAMVESPPDNALRAASHSIDLDSQALVPVDRLVRFTTTRSEAQLELSVSTGFISTIPNSRFQQVKVSGEREVIITLSAPTFPDHIMTTTVHHQHTALASSIWMPTQDPALIKMATKAAGPEDDPLRICKRLEDFVGRNMNRSTFSASMIPANEVARTLRGDCTEHAVLLAALMRTKGIPARIASGLIQTHNQYGFQGHAWVEALLGEEWLPFDSTTDSQVPRIKLADSELPDSATGGISLFLPVMELAGRARLRVLRDDSQPTKN